MRTEVSSIKIKFRLRFDHPISKQSCTQAYLGCFHFLPSIKGILLSSLWLVVPPLCLAKFSPARFGCLVLKWAFSKMSTVNSFPFPPSTTTAAASVLQRIWMSPQKKEKEQTTSWPSQCLPYLDHLVTCCWHLPVIMWSSSDLWQQKCQGEAARCAQKVNPGSILCRGSKRGE